MLCTGRDTLVAQTLVERGSGAMSMLANAVRYVIKSQLTGLSGAARPVQMRKPISAELCTARQPLVVERHPIHEHPSVIIGSRCNPRRPAVEARGTVDTGSCLQNPQYVPVRDAMTVLSPLSLPYMSGKTSESGETYKEMTPEPLKMIESFVHQKLPKDRKTWSVIIYTSSGLPVRT